MALVNTAEELDRKHPDLKRYNRQMLLSAIGPDGQRRLLASKVLLLGCGALGTVLANTLARAGVGHLTIVDRDFIELNNLQRQILFDEDDIRDQLPKSIAAKRKIEKINSSITVDALVTDVNVSNIESLAAGKDLLLDGTDNFETRLLVNDVSSKLSIPWIYGACISAMGLAMVIRPGHTPCLRCLFESTPPPGMNPTCETAGVLGAGVNMVASWQANEAIKILTGNTDAISPFLFSFDLWDNRFQQLKVSPVPDCPVCHRKNYEYLGGHFASSTTTLCGRNAVQLSIPGDHRINFSEIAAKLQAVGSPTFNRFMLKCIIAEGEGATRKEFELTLFADGRAIIKGTHDATVARAMYSKYVGM